VEWSVCTVLAFVWTYRERSRKICHDSRCPGRHLNMSFPNTKQKCYQLDCDFRCNFCSAEVHSTQTLWYQYFHDSGHCILRFRLICSESWQLVILTKTLSVSLGLVCSLWEYCFEGHNSEIFMVFCTWASGIASLITDYGSQFVSVFTST
jgi:hypothetical protein